MKKFALFVAVVMVFVLVATACTKEKSNSDPTSTPSSDQTSAPTAEPQDTSPIEFTVAAPTFGFDPTGTQIQQEYEKAMDAYMGRHVAFGWDRKPWGDYLEKVPVMLASGEIPDVMLIWGIDKITQYGNEGLFVNLADHLDKMPNYKKFLDATADVENYLYTGEGKLYAFFDGFINPLGIEPAQTGAMYRLDAFEKHGIKVPTTTDELYDAAKKLKELYPDSYPIGAYGQGLSLSGFWSSFHTDGWIYWDGSAFVYGPATENYRETLEYVRKLYAEGLIDPAFWTDDLDQAKAKATTGKAFIYPTIYSGWQGELYRGREASNTTWALSLFPDNPKYGKAWRLFTEPQGQSLYDYYGIVISSKAKNLDDIIKIIDYQYSEKMMDLLNWGIEGTTFQVVDGKKQYVPAINDAADKGAELAKYCLMPSGSCRPGIVFTPQDRVATYSSSSDTLFYYDGQAKVENLWFANAEHGGPETVPPSAHAPRVVFTQEENDIIAQEMNPIYTYVDESIVKFMNGEMDLAKWDEFQAEIKKLGDYELVLKMHNDKVKK